MRLKVDRSRLARAITLCTTALTGTSWILLVGCSSGPPESAFPPELRVQVLADRDDPTTWDMDRVSEDIETARQGPPIPFTFGAFPTPDYDRLGDGSFTGTGISILPGVQGLHGTIDDKTLLASSFTVNRNAWNEPIVGDAETYHFFRLVVLTDFIDEKQYSHLGVRIVSRNHPDVIGQGFFRTSQQRIDYSAFQVVEGDAYAVVNLRLFDLEHGSTILIAPQKDGSLRSKQIHTADPSGEDLRGWLDTICVDPDVRAFFLAPGAI